jgi:subtilisin-like proprotein convertase family protein
MFTRWSYTPPTAMALEGPYELSLKITDVSGNVQLLPGLWKGQIDTKPPRIFSTSTNAGGGQNRDYALRASDYNLVDDNFNSYCGAGTIERRIDNSKGWYQAVFKQVASDGTTNPAPDKLYQLQTTCTLSPTASVQEVHTCTRPDCFSITPGWIAVDGATLFVVGAHGFEMLDISNPTSPTVQMTYKESYSFFSSIAVKDTYVYALSEYGGLDIIDIADKSAPRKVVDNFGPDGSFNALVIAGNYAYLASKTHLKGNGYLLVLDISNPTSPQQVGRYDLTSAWDVAVDGTYAYVANDQAGVTVLNIANPASPVLAGSYDTPGSARSIALKGNYAYIADDSGGLQVVTITSPGTPARAGSASTLGKAKDVAVTGNYAYVIDDQNILTVFDIVSPNNPSAIAVNSFDAFSSLASTFKTMSVDVQGSYAYVAGYMQNISSSGSIHMTDMIKVMGDGSTAGKEPTNACDSFGNCTSSDGQGSKLAADRLPKIDAMPTNTPSPVAVVIEKQETIVNSRTRPITLNVRASSNNSLQSLNLLVNKSAEKSWTWNNGVMTNTLQAVAWTPPADGTYTFAAVARDYSGATTTATDFVLVDTQIPTVTLSRTLYTNNDYGTSGFINLNGTVLDDGGLLDMNVSVTYQGNTIPLDVQLDSNEPSADNPPIYGSPPQPSYWKAAWLMGQPGLTSNQQATVRIVAYDAAGNVTTIERDITIDPVLPTLNQMTLGYQHADGSTVPIQAGDIISDTQRPILTIEWSPSSDESGIAHYHAGWTTTRTPDTASLTTYDGNTTRHTQQAGEAERLYAHLIAEDGSGNMTIQTLGPVSIDYHTTPAYISMHEVDGQPYRGWMEGPCNQLGTDNRIAQNAVHGATLNDPQKLSATWNADGLRMAWSGANWNTDGDLFVYLDTQPGGSIRAYNPYTTSLTTDILLPRLQSAAATALSTSDNSIDATSTTIATFSRPRRAHLNASNQNYMGADYLIWAQTTTTATLLRWDEKNQTWQPVADADWEYRFEESLEVPQTDIFLPFGSIGVNDAASATLALLAFASEDDRLRLWATMPARNSVNSERIVDTTGVLAIHRFALTNAYTWSSLDDGVCPSGVNQNDNGPGASLQQSGDAQSGFNSADVQVTMTADPPGIGYRLLGDNLFFIMDQLTQFETPEWASDQDSNSSLDFNAKEGLDAIMNVMLAPLGDGDQVSYHISYVNRSDVTAHDLVIDVATWGPIRLPDGETYQDSFGEFDTLEILVGDLAPGESGSYHFEGQVDTKFDEQNNEGWATLDVIVYDASGSLDENQIDWLFLDHEVDQIPPDYIEIQEPVSVIGAGKTTVQGFVFDYSAVPNIVLEVTRPDGTKDLTDCLDDTPLDYYWACEVNIGAAKDGDTIVLRARAMDIHGNAGEWGESHTLVVDTTPPTLTLSAATQANLADGILGPSETTLRGNASDNRLIGSVEVCQEVAENEEVCETTSLTLDPTTVPSTTLTLDDTPTTPQAIGTCGSGELVRTFTVEPDLTISDLDVGLRIDHPDRSMLEVRLQSPSGKTIQIVGYGTDRANYDMLLNDAAPLLITDDDTPHDAGVPIFENERGPSPELLASFNGSQTQGLWKLTMCNTDASNNTGSYRTGRLLFTTHQVPVDTTATWNYEVTIPTDSDGVLSHIRLYALDSTGNRTVAPLEQTVRLDNVAPDIALYTVRDTLVLSEGMRLIRVPPSRTISGTNTITATYIASPTLVLSGTVAASGNVRDGSSIGYMQMTILKPNGDMVIDPISYAGSEWSYTNGTTGTHSLSHAGRYTLWVEATDKAGNLAMVEANTALVEQRRIYLPVITKE